MLGKTTQPETNGKDQERRPSRGEETVGRGRAAWLHWGRNNFSLKLGASKTWGREGQKTCKWEWIAGKSPEDRKQPDEDFHGKVIQIHRNSLPLEGKNCLPPYDFDYGQEEPSLGFPEQEKIL